MGVPKSFLKKLLSVSLSLIYFLVATTFSHAAETNFWKARRALQPNAHIVFNSSHLLPFTAPQSAWNQKPSMQSIKPLGNSRLAAIPFKYASLRDLYKGDPTPISRFVYIVQDVHQNHEAQGHIVQVLKALRDRAGEAKRPLVIGVEAAFQPFDFSRFHAFPSEEIKTAVAEHFLAENQIGAPSYVGMTAGKSSPVIVGIDDSTHHKANVRAYLDGSARQAALQKEAARAEEKIVQEKYKSLSPQLRQLDELTTGFESGKGNFGEYVVALSRLYEGEFSDDSHDFAVTQFLTAYDLEQSLQFKQVERERALVIDQLSRRLSPAQLDRLVNLSLSYQSGQISYADYYGTVRSLIRQCGISLAATPQFEKYVQYVLLADGIKADRLLAAAKEMRETLVRALAKTDSERRLMAASRRLELTKKLLSFALTPEEWEDYRVLKAEVPSALRPFERFYLEADIRSDRMVENMLQQFPDAGEAILVAGGFHSTRMAKRLRERGISHAVIQPKITRIDDENGTAYLSIFQRERTPLEKLFKGQQLYLGAPDMAWGSGKNPAQDVAILGTTAFFHARRKQKVNPGTGVQATQADENILRLDFGPEGVSLNAGDTPQKGKTPLMHLDIQSLGMVYFYGVALNPLPELISYLLLPAFQFFMPSTPALWLFFIGSFFLRLSVFLSRFIHGSGHAAATLWTDRTVRLSNIAEGITLAQFLIGLAPAAPLPLITFGAPAKHAYPTGNPAPEKVKIKAFGGIAMNLFAAALLSGVQIFALPMFVEVHSYQLLFLLTLMFASASYAFLSLTDIPPMFSGIARLGFYCGDMGVAIFPKTGRQADPRRLDRGSVPKTKSDSTTKLRPDKSSFRSTGTALPRKSNPMLDWATQKLRAMGQQTQIRGKQAGGMAVILRGSDGRNYLIVVKDVNPKRGNLTEYILRQWNKEVDRSRKKGLELPENVIIVGHYRFGTSSRPSKIETHPHPGADPLIVRHWKFDAAGHLQFQDENFQVIICHNGDFNGLIKMLGLEFLGEKLTYKEVRESLNRAVGLNPTSGDSRIVAQMLSLLRTQGIWEASVRLAFIMEITKGFRDAFKDMSAKQVQEFLKPYVLIFETAFEKHRDNLFAPGAQLLSELNRAYLEKVYLPELYEMMKSNFNTRSLDETTQKAFVDSAVFNFLHNDMEMSLRIFAGIQNKSSTFGLPVLSTLDSDELFLLAKGQPLTIGHEDHPGHNVFFIDSEPAAALAALDGNGHILDLDDKNGQIAVIGKHGVRVFSITDGDDVPEEKSEAQWVPVANNPYILPIEPPHNNQTRKDLDEISLTVEKIDVEWNKESSRNRATANALLSDIRDIVKAGGYRGGPNPYLDILLVGEEKNFDSLRRFGETLKLQKPWLNIKIMTGNEFFKLEEELHGGFTSASKPERYVVGPQTVALFVSQSGQTFSTRIAKQWAEYHKQKTHNADRETDKLYRNVYWLTGEWYSKMAQDAGQSFQPDAPFIPRGFCNMSGRRVSEASSVSTVATDYLLGKIFRHVAAGVLKDYFPTNFQPSNKRPSKLPLNMKMSPPTVEVLNQAADPYFKKLLPVLTGKDEDGNTVVTETHSELREIGRQFGVHALEPLAITCLTILFTVLTVKFHITPIQAMGFPLLVAAQIFSHLPFSAALVPLIAPVLSWATFIAASGAFVEIAGWTNALYYGFQWWIIIFAVRYLQNRERWARTGVRALTIASKSWKTLRDYGTRLMGENIGHAEIFIDGRKPDGDLVHRMAHTIRRGSLILVTLLGELALTRSQAREKDGTGMAVSQAGGIASGLTKSTVAGPEIQVLETALTERMRMFQERNAAALESDKVLRELIREQYIDEINLIAGFVLLESVADTISKFRFPFYTWLEGGWKAQMLNYTVGMALLGFSAVFRFAVLLFINGVFTLFYGADFAWQIFKKGVSHSGTAIATTQIVPPPLFSVAGTHVDSKEFSTVLARKADLFRKMGVPAQEIKWVPSNGQIAPLLAHVFTEDVISLPAAESPVLLTIENETLRITVTDTESFAIEFGNQRILSVDLTYNSQTDRIEGLNGRLTVEPASDASVRIVCDDAVRFASRDPRTDSWTRKRKVFIEQAKPEFVSHMRNINPKLRLRIIEEVSQGFVYSPSETEYIKSMSVRFPVTKKTASPPLKTTIMDVVSRPAANNKATSTFPTTIAFQTPLFVGAILAFSLLPSMDALTAASIANVGGYLLWPVTGIGLLLFVYRFSLYLTQPRLVLSRDGKSLWFVCPMLSSISINTPNGRTRRIQFILRNAVLDEKKIKVYALKDGSMLVMLTPFGPQATLASKPDTGYSFYSSYHHSSDLDFRMAISTRLNNRMEAIVSTTPEPNQNTETKVGAPARFFTVSSKLSSIHLDLSPLKTIGSSGILVGDFS